MFPALVIYLVLLFFLCSSTGSTAWFLLLCLVVVVPMVLLPIYSCSGSPGLFGNCDSPGSSGSSCSCMCLGSLTSGFVAPQMCFFSVTRQEMTVGAICPHFCPFRGWPWGGMCSLYIQWRSYMQSLIWSYTLLSQSRHSLCYIPHTDCMDAVFTWHCNSYIPTENSVSIVYGL